MKKFAQNYDVAQLIFNNLPDSEKERIRKEYEDKKLTPEKMRIIMMGESRKANRKVTLKNKRINEYFPSEYSAGQIEEIIYSLLERWRTEQNE